MTSRGDDAKGKGKGKKKKTEDNEPAGGTARSIAPQGWPCWAARPSLIQPTRRRPCHAGSPFHFDVTAVLRRDPFTTPADVQASCTGYAVAESTGKEWCLGMPMRLLRANGLSFRKINGLLTESMLPNQHDHASPNA
ncbi:hypothetical protein CKO51_14865 [Rhodopirellula sp. SM50]|nr:hypothetical protein CKO51_14865 [Rhodopirellula sp. SM50]